MTAQANERLLVWQGARWCYSPKYPDQSEVSWSKDLESCESSPGSLPFHPAEGGEVQRAAPAHPGSWRSRKRRSRGAHALPGASSGASRENIKRNWEKLSSDRTQVPKPTKVGVQKCRTSQVALGAWYRRSSEKLQRVGGWVASVQEQDKSVKVSWCTLIFTSPSGMTLIICS